MLALFEGGPEGLSLTSTATEPNLPDPTALAFSALTGGQVQFYAATAGRESADAGGAEPGDGDRVRDGRGDGDGDRLGLGDIHRLGTAGGDRDGPGRVITHISVSATGTGTGAASPSSAVSVQLVALHDTSLPLAATVLTLTVSNSCRGDGPGLR